MNSLLGSHRTALTTAVAAILAVTATGCGAAIERATEEAVERAVESEGGGDVDVDFDSDSGTFSVEGDDGVANLSFDEDGIRIDGTDADGNDFSLDADENGLNAESENGGSIEADEDGSFTATDADGNTTTGEATDEGIETFDENGKLTFSSGAGIPEPWPGDVPLPDGFEDVTHTLLDEFGITSIVLIGYVADGADASRLTYEAAASSAGFDVIENPDDTGLPGIGLSSGFRGDESFQMTAIDDSDDAGAAGRTQISLTYGLISES